MSAPRWIAAQLLHRSCTVPRHLMTPNPHPDHPLIGHVGSTFSILNPTSPPNLLVSLLAKPQSLTRYYESLLIALFAPALAPTPDLSHRFPGYLNKCKLDFLLFCFPTISQQFYPTSSLWLPVLVVNVGSALDHIVHHAPRIVLV